MSLNSPTEPSPAASFRVSERGPLSLAVLRHLDGSGLHPPSTVADADGFGDDLQLALYLAYELHYGTNPFDGTPAGDDEWDLGLLAFRRQLEDRFLEALRDEVGSPTAPSAPLREVMPQLVAADDGPSLSAFMAETGTLEHMCQIVKHRSLYQLKEADPHTYAIPHLRGRAKEILAEIQAGEYGADGPHYKMHATLFAQTMRELGLDDQPNRYLDEVPAGGLALSNVISLFGLHRRWRGALLGHLAVFEMTSVAPMGRYGAALRRLGATDAARRFYDVHVLADAVHETLVLDMVEAFEADEPRLAGDVVFGGRCALAIERRFASELLTPWTTPADPALAAA